MILCQKAKFDQKNRILIPRDYIREAGGSDNCSCYITFNEATREIKILVKPIEDPRKGAARIAAVAADSGALAPAT